MTFSIPKAVQWLKRIGRRKVHFRVRVDLIEIGGYVTVAAGIGLVYVPAAVIFAGAALIFLTQGVDDVDN